MNILLDVAPELTQSSINVNSELYSGCNIDSRRFLQILIKIEKYFGYTINDEDLLEAEIVTIDDLIKFVDKQNIKNC